MRFVLQFQFNHELRPAAVTGVEGEMTDLLLPSVGDLVEHRQAGIQFEGRVTDRGFRYELPEGVNVSGTILVTLWLDRTVVH